MKILFLVLLLILPNAHAQEDVAYLSKKFERHVHPEHKFEALNIFSIFEKIPVRSDLQSTFEFMTPVRSQKSRGTCSIFSAVALLEALLVNYHGYPEDLDLSEEWLEYVVTRYKSEDGSHSDVNIRNIVKHGVPLEETLPYIGYEWEKIVPGTLSEERCGHLEDHWTLKSCLIGHWDPAYLTKPSAELETIAPEFLEARREAAKFRNRHYLNKNTYSTVKYIKDIKRKLSKGELLTLDVDFYYGAWNHSEATKLDIPRSLKQWDLGIVGFPLYGSKDYINTQKDPAGHSVLVVGYDDDIEIELEHEMPDGKIIKRTYQGVYYFKNSWGTSGFGKDFEFNGKALPGYGMIVQEYAHKMGTFYHWDMLN